MINIEKYELDFTDAVFLEKLQEAYEVMTKATDDKKEFEKATDKIRYNCDIVKTFIDNVLGDGASKDILGESYSFNKHLEVVEYFNEKMESTNKMLKDKSLKYSANRIKR